MKKRLLICLEKLDIGGVETSVINQAKEYKRRGYDVTIMAKRGIYTEELEKDSIECVNYEFFLEDKFFLEKETYIKKIIDDRNITEIHIHQYPCIIHLLPILLKNNIPYVAFVHSIIDGTYEWFMNTFRTYNIAFPLFFQNANKIVTIREKEIDYNSDLFKIKDKSKYFILKNSIDFNQLPKNKKYPDQINNYLIISRISKEKLVSIEKGIEFYLNIKNSNKKLSILGDGDELEYLKNKYKNYEIEFLGKSNKVYEIISKYDAVIGVDRCILEAICCRKISILSSYEGLIEIVNKDNIENLSKENFSGKNLKESSNIIEKINNISKKEYKCIVEDNYKYAYENFNIKNNILDEKLSKEYIDYNVIYEYSNYLTKNLNDLERCNKEREEEMNKIKNSRSWKIFSTIVKIFKKITRLLRGE